MQRLFHTFLLCLIAHVQTSKAWPEQTTVIIGTNYLTQIDAVVASNDGSILIGNADGIKEFEPTLVPKEFLESWGIQKTEIEAIYLEVLKEQKRKSELASEEQKALKQEILRDSPNLQFPFLASKPIVILDDIINRGDRFTVIPFWDESIQKTRLRTVIERENGDWTIFDRNTGIPPMHYDDIELQTTRIPTSNAYYRVIQRPRTGYRTVTYTSKAENTFSRQERYEYAEFFLTTSGNQNDKDAMAYVIGVSGNMITDSFLMKGNEDFSIGTNDSHAQGPRVRSNKWIFISPKGIVSKYPN